MEKQESKKRFPTFPQPSTMKKYNQLWDTDSEGKVRVKKAIEGGWEEKERAAYRLFRVANDLDLELDSVLLSPAFWQSLGKALGWGHYAPYGLEKTSALGYDDPRLSSWLWHWYRFIDYLAKGGNAESLFETLS